MKGQEADRTERLLYDSVHFAFGLPSRSNGRNGDEYKRPMNIKWDGNFIKSFQITGDRLSDLSFTQNGWSNIFTKIDREIPTRPGYAFAYNVSLLYEGILSAYPVRVGSPELEFSNQLRVILDIVGHTIYTRKLNVPYVHLELGEVWQKYGQPDRILIRIVGATAQISTNEMTRLYNAITFHYKLAETSSVSFRAVHDEPGCAIELMLAEKPVDYNPQPRQAEPARQEEPAFPYEYYRSIGLINDEGMVIAKTMLGDMYVRADSEMGREALLKAGTEY